MDKFIVVVGKTFFKENGETYYGFAGNETFNDLKQAKDFKSGFDFAIETMRMEGWFCEIYNHLDYNDEKFENEIKLYLERKKVI